MKIRRIELFNLGPYIDKNVFEMNCDKVRHIVLIGGKNGAGKTTFFKAIKTCLYGCKALGFEAPGKEYFRQMSNLVNSRMQFDSKFNAYVEIELEFDDGKQVNYYVLHREWNRVKKNVDEKFFILKNGSELDKDSVIDFSNYLLSIIPPDMFNFYFFDGESIADFFLGNEGNKNFKNAFLKLYGLDTLSLMVENFERSFKKSENKGNACNTYREIKAEYETTVAHLEDLKAEKKELKDKIELFQVQLQALRNDYQNSGGVSLSEWKNFSTELVREEAKREEYNRWLKDFANHYLPFIIVEDQLKNVLSQIELEQNAKKKAIAKEELNSQNLKDKLSEFLYGLGFDGIFADKILSFIQEETFEASDLSVIFDFSEAQTTRIISQIYEKLDFDKSLVRRAIKELKDSLANTKKIRDLKLGSNIDGYEEYAQKKLELERNVEKTITQLEQIDKKIFDHEILIEQQKKELIKAKELYEKDLKNKSISRMAERAIWVYSKLEDQLIERQSKILQDEFLKCFSAIINKDNFIDGIIIDKNINVVPYKFIDISYSQIDNYIKDNESSRFLDHFDKKYLTAINDLRLGKVDVIKLPVQITAPFSQGERQVYIMALYLALLKTSNKDIPFFIDTPFARIDSNHRDRIIKEFFKGITNQIFILSTDEEIIGEYEVLMEDAIAKKFLLEIGAYGKTRVISDRYFEVHNDI